MEMLVDFMGQSLEKDSSQSENRFGYVDTQKDDEKQTQSVHGLLTRLVGIENHYHAYQQKDGREPIKSANPCKFPLLDEIPVDVPVGQSHQDDEEKEKFE